MYSKRQLRGRGAASNPEGRFETTSREPVDDGWGAGWEDEDWAPPRLQTTVTRDLARSLITTNQSPDIPFDQSINPYRGCEHGCVYCYARPDHGYLGLSPGLDFESRLFFKADAADRLREALAKPGYRCRVIALGASTDPYQPVERRLRVTREILEVLAECRHPVTIITKGSLVLRDLDLLADMAKDKLARVMVSVTSLDAGLKRRLEPRAAAPRRRLEMLRALSGAGVSTGVLVAPVIPALTDHELEAILEAAADAGASSAGYILLRLPHEVEPLVREWLARHYPDRADHVMSLLAQAHEGRPYRARFHRRMRGTGPWAELLATRFQLACQRLGLRSRESDALETGHFVPPGDGRQMALL